MEVYTITKEQILEGHGAACNEWKKKIESWFPDVFKHEIQKGASENGLDVNSLTGGITEEIESAKQSMNNALNPVEFQNPVEEIKEEFENLSGPIKRQM